MKSLTQVSNCLTLDGSFSAVSTATIARKDAFFSIFRDLQDLCAFAPLRSQNFSKKLVQNFARMKFHFISFQPKSMKFALFSTKFQRNFVGISRRCAEDDKICRYFDKSCGKVRKMAKNTEMVRNFIQFHFFISLFQSSPYLRRELTVRGQQPYHHLDEPEPP